jgi:hypothetical protein
MSLESLRPFGSTSSFETFIRYIIMNGKRQVDDMDDLNHFKHALQVRNGGKYLILMKNTQ